MRARRRDNRSVEAPIAFLVDHLNACFQQHDRHGTQAIMKRRVCRGRMQKLDVNVCERRGGEVEGKE